MSRTREADVWVRGGLFSRESGFYATDYRKAGYSEAGEEGQQCDDCVFVES